MSKTTKNELLLDIDKFKYTMSEKLRSGCTGAVKLKFEVSAIEKKFRKLQAESGDYMD